MLTMGCLSDGLYNKSSAVAEMGDHLATIDMAEKWGGAADCRIFAFVILS